MQFRKNTVKKHRKTINTNMKLKFIIFAIFATQFFSAQTTKNKVNPKNIEYWINQNFSNDRTSFNNGKYMFVAFTQVNNGILSQKNITKYLESRFSFLDQKAIMNLNLKDLYYDSVTYEERGGHYYIYAKCVNNVICSRSLDEKGQRNGSESPLLGMIATNQADINKCTEAFSKLIKFYGGKKQYNW